MEKLRIPTGGEREQKNPPKVLEATELVLRDAQGNVRIRLSPMGYRDSDLVFFDEQGRDRLAVGTLDGRPTVALSDLNGQHRAEISVEEDGGAAEVQLIDADFTVRASLYQDEDGASLEVRNRHGKSLITVACGREGPAVVRTCDGKGRLRAGLGAADSPGELCLADGQVSGATVVAVDGDTLRVLLGDTPDDSERPAADGSGTGRHPPPP